MTAPVLLGGDLSLCGEADGSRVRPSYRSCSILGMRIDELDYACVTEQIRKWVGAAESRSMCISTVHMIMESFDNRHFQAIVNSADLVAADGIPVIWVSRWLGLTGQSRVFAPDLVIRLCAFTAEEAIPVGFFGSTPDVIRGIVHNLGLQFPRLNVAFSCSPPFRTPTPDEINDVAREINESGTRILFVGLGCPKQERWMNEMRSRVQAVMIGVGWAFDVVAGQSKTAPAWIQNMGMEWCYRLVLNPKKLWRRHLKNNPRFVVLVLLQLLRARRIIAWGVGGGR